MNSIGMSRISCEWFIRNVASKPVALTLLFVPIPLIGLVSEVCGVDNAFNKSGALLVCVAIFCVYLNHFLSKEIERQKSEIKAIKEIGLSREAKINTLKVAVPEEMVATIADHMEAVFNNFSNDIPELELTQRKLVITEFSAGIVGTLVWGFGDLIQLISWV